MFNFSIPIPTGGELGGVSDGNPADLRACWRARLSAFALAVVPALAAWIGRPSRDGEFAPGPFAALASVARSGQRSWRIGSLVLMLLAVFKVFIFDAAGLDGLARIASFLALGVCLIGIGWFYSRQLVANRGGNGDVRTGSGA